MLLKMLFKKIARLCQNTENISSLGENKDASSKDADGDESHKSSAELKVKRKHR